MGAAVRSWQRNVEVVPPVWHHVVAPASLRTWFEFFTTNTADQIHHVGEGDAYPGDLLGSLKEAGATHVAVHSSHSSLLRDCDIAGELRGAGMVVVAQNRGCAEIGLDKTRMKRFLESAGFSVPSSVSTDKRWVVKRCGGTEAAGMRLEREVPALEPGEFAEQFIDGDEFSVVLFAWGGRVITFPPVYKGPTRIDLIPPYRRPRVCPAPESFARHCQALRSVARGVAVAAGCEGWMEVEFVLTTAGEPVILEFNPRVSGTMRLSAMASRVPVFDLPHLMGSVPDDIRAVRYGAELPWRGSPIANPAADVFATSRMTAAADSIPELAAKIAGLGAAPVPYWNGAPDARRRDDAAVPFTGRT
jgi:hypothetical protein